MRKLIHRINHFAIIPGLLICTAVLTVHGAFKKNWTHCPVETTREPLKQLRGVYTSYGTPVLAVTRANGQFQFNTPIGPDSKFESPRLRFDSESFPHDPADLKAVPVVSSDGKGGYTFSFELADIDAIVEQFMAGDQKTAMLNLGCGAVGLSNAPEPKLLSRLEGKMYRVAGIRNRRTKAQ